MPALREQRQADHGEFEASLVSSVSSRTERAIQSDFKTKLGGEGVWSVGG